MLMGSDRQRWSRFDHIKFGLSTFVLGAIAGLCISLTTVGGSTFSTAVGCGLFLWLAPLLFVGWLRICEKYFLRGLLMPVWRKLGLIS